MRTLYLYPEGVPKREYRIDKDTVYCPNRKCSKAKFDTKLYGSETCKKCNTKMKYGKRYFTKQSGKPETIWK